MNIVQFRQQHPEYGDLDDETLSQKLHAKNYSDIDYDAFRSTFIGATPPDDSQFGQGYRDELVAGMEPAVPTPAPPPQPLAMQDPVAAAPSPGATAPQPVAPRGGFAASDPRLAGLKPGERQAAIEANSPGYEPGSIAAGTLAATRQLAISPARAINEKLQRDDQIDLARAEVMPDAVAYAREHKINILDVPAVQAKSKELGLRPDAFIRGGADYLKMTPAELAARKAERTGSMKEREFRLSTAREMYKENNDEIAGNRPTAAPVKAFFYDLATAAPKLAGTVAAGMATGGAGGLAVMGASVYPDFYNDGLDRHLTPEQASGFAMLMTAAETVPETFVFGKVFNKAATNKAVKDGLLKAFGKDTLEAGLLEAPSEMITEAIEMGIEHKAFGDETSLPDALKRIGYAGLTGFGMGVGLGGPGAAARAVSQATDRTKAAPDTAKEVDLLQRAHEAYITTLADTMAELSAQKMPQSLRKQEAEKRAQAAALDVVAQFSPVDAAKLKLDKLEQDAKAGKTVDPKEIEAAREAHETAVIESGRANLRSGRLTPEQQQQAAQALQDIDETPEDGEPGTIPGQVRETAPAKPTATETAPAAPGAPKAVKPAEPLSEVETQRHDALTRVANADTIEETALNELIAGGLAKINPQSGRPILLPPGKRQRIALNKRAEAAEEAEKEAAKPEAKPAPVAKKLQPKSPKKAKTVAAAPQTAQAEQAAPAAEPATAQAEPKAKKPRAKKAAVQVSAVSTGRVQTEKVNKPKKSKGVAGGKSIPVKEPVAPKAAAPVAPETYVLTQEHTHGETEILRTTNKPEAQKKMRALLVNDPEGKYRVDTIKDEEMPDRDGPEGDFTPSQPIETEAMDEPQFAAANDVVGKKRKAGGGFSYTILHDRKDVGRIAGFERGNAFHIYRTGIRDKNANLRGTGLYQKAVQQVADQHPEGAFVHEWEASKALQKSLRKMPTFEEVGDRLYVRPTNQRTREITAERQAVLDQKEPGSAQAATKALLDRPGERDAAKKRIDQIQGKIRTTRPDDGEPTFAVAGGEDKPAGFHQDNPAVRDGGERGHAWLANKQKNAEEDMATARKRGDTSGSMARGLIGSTTAWVDGLDIPVAELQKLQGVNGEKRVPGESQYDRLKQKVLENGWKQEWNAMVQVNHKGEAFIAEGNTRTAVAAAVGQPTVRVEIRWQNGGEMAKGPFSPANVKRMTEPEEPAFSAAEAAPELPPEGQPLLAPNGKPSKLSRAQWQQVRTPEFKAWFGDWEKFALMQGGVWNDSKGEVSKVVDPETGEPLVVYHGTNKGGFRVFDNGRGKQNTMAPKGTAYFSNARGMARTYTHSDNEIDLEPPEAPPEGYVVSQEDDDSWTVQRGTMILDSGHLSRRTAVDWAWREYGEMFGDGSLQQRGIYSVFLNIRDPNEEDFEGANWDGTRAHQWEIVRLIDGFRDAGSDPIYAEDGTRYFPDEEEALNVAHAQGLEADGYEIVQAGYHGQSTDGVTREAMSGGNDGAIIRNVLDEGGYGYGGNDPSDVFVAFNPTQIKSAEWNNGKFDPANEDITFSAAPMFYSALTNAAINAKITKGTGEQWYKTLLNTPGVKHEELEWSDIGTWLHGWKSVTKEQVVDYLRAHEITIEETVRDEDSGKVVNLRDMEAESQKRYGKPYDDLSPGETAALHQETQMWPGAKRPGSGKPIKFNRSDLVTPGGMEGQYRELLLRLPEQAEHRPTDELSTAERKAAMRKEIDGLNVHLRDGTFDMEAFVQGFRVLRNKYGMPEGMRFDDWNGVAERGNERTFTSGHWDEENVLAHVRFTTRNDVGGPPGERYAKLKEQRRNSTDQAEIDRLNKEMIQLRDKGNTLFIEEIQSDWHQRGRKQGYRTNEKLTPTESARLQELTEKSQRSPAAGLNKNERDEFHKLIAKNTRGQTGVPDAPFKTTWPELAMKRIIRWAAENGYDQVAWTSGDMQNARYDLSKHLDKVHVEEYSRASVGRPGTYNVTGYKDGTDVVAERQIPAEDLEKYIGKDLAEKMLADMKDSGETSSTMTGLNLQVGGEGMKGFYDKILVAAADKLGKKYGTKTGASSLFLADDTAGVPMDEIPESEKQPIHVLRMTPELKTAALGGFPMFAAAKSKPVGNMNVSQVEALLPPIEAAMGVPIGVVQTQEELPPHLAAFAARKNARSKKGFRAAGVFDDLTGKLWLVAGNLNGAEHAVETAYHEISHKGLRYLLGANYGAAMEEIIRSFPDDVLAAQKKNQIGVDANGKLADFKDLSEVKRHLSAEEAVAYAAGSLLLKTGGKDERSRWRKMIDAVRRYLRAHGILKSMNDNDLNDLIYRAAIAAGQAQANLKYAADVADARAKGTPIPKPNPVNDGPLLGMPTKTSIPGQGDVAMGPHKPARRAAADYKNKAKLRYADVRTYAKVNPATGKRIADAYQKMKHDPLNPRVQAAYKAMVKETLAQYQAIKATGLRVEFIPTGQNPYAASPRMAIEDVRNNNHLWVFPSDDGFGQEGADADYYKNNPLLEKTDEYVGQKQLLANDVFRIVHDYFGHIKEGNGFRHDGEENAWRVHATMYSPLARAAMTSETRGQNSWLNWGPHGEKNRNAKNEETVYAPQKIGLLPPEFWNPEPEIAHATDPAFAAEEPKKRRFGFWFGKLPEDVAKVALERANKIVKKARLGKGYTPGGEMAYEIKFPRMTDRDPKFDETMGALRAAGFHPDVLMGPMGGWVADSAFIGDVMADEEPAFAVADEVADTIREIAGHLTDEERAPLNRSTAKKLVKLFDELPDEKERGAVALAGAAAKGWYRDSAETILDIFGMDSPRFAALLAALSPQVSVQANLSNAVGMWRAWVEAGRPTDKKTIKKLMGKSLWNAHDKKGKKVGVLDAWVNNTVRALSSTEPHSIVLSGPKVSSFAANLRGEVNQVTLDSWMAAFDKLDAAKWFAGTINKKGTNPGKRPGYLAVSARTRQTAKYLTEKTGEVWTPDQVQETIWSWTKTLAELAYKFGPMSSAEEIVKNGELTNELVNATTNFATLFALPEHQEALRALGYGERLDRADERAKARAGTRRQAPSLTGEDQQRVLTAARRLDSLRAEKPDLGRAGAAVMRAREEDDDLEHAFSVLGGNTGDPKLDAFMSKIGSKRRTLGQWWADTTENLGNRIRFNAADDLWGIGAAGQTAGLSLADVGYKNAQLARNAAELTQLTFEHGYPVWHKDGTHEVAGIAGDKGAIDILKPLKEKLNLFFAWKIARRADRLMGEDRENWFEQDEIDAAKNLHLQHPEFVNVDKEYVAFKNKILDFAQEAGIIDPESRALWEHDDYIPFYRIIESAQNRGAIDRAGTNALGKVRNQIRRLKGGKAQLGDPLENISKNWLSLIDASLKAHAARTVIDALDGTGLVTKAKGREFMTQAVVPLSQVGDFIKNNPLLAAHLKAAGVDPAKLPPAAFAGLQKMLAVQAPEGDDIVTVWRNGKREYWHAHDELLLQSLLNIPKAAWGPWMEFFRFPKRVFTATTTSTPQFGLRNIFRDMLHAFITGAVGRKTTIIPGYDTVKGAVAYIRQTQDALDMMAAGGSFTHGYIRGGDMAGAAATVRRAVHKVSPFNTVLDTPFKLVRFYRDFLNDAENAHRVAMYQRMRKAGASRLDAAYEARDLLDFSKQGANNLTRFIVQSVPFWNARLQGLDRIYRGPGGKKAVVASIFLRGALYTMAMAALMSLYYDDDRYKKLTDADKANFIHLFDVFGEGDHWTIPVPFEMGTLFGTVPMAIYDYFVTNADEPDRMKQSLSLLGSAFMNTLNMRPDIAATTPLMELAINKDLYTQAPILNQGDVDVLPEEQDDPRVNPTYRLISRLLPDAAPDALRSPKQFQHLARGYVGNVQDYLMMATDVASRRIMGEPPREERQNPFASAFRRDGPARLTKQSVAMYDVADKADRIAASVSRLEKAGTDEATARIEELQEDNAPLLNAGDAFSDAAKSVGDIRKNMRQVQLDPDMTPAEKKEEIDAMQEEINEIALDVWDLRPGGKLNAETAEELLGEDEKGMAETLRRKGFGGVADALEALE